MKKLALFVAFVLSFTSLSGCEKKVEESIAIKEIAPYIFETDTYTELDYDFAQKFFKEHNDNWGGGCSCVAKNLDDGRVVFGRNMDLSISHKSAYIVRTACKDKYKTFGTQYTFRDYSPTYDEVKENGLPLEYSKLIPFLCDDIMNEKGLFIEVNMRNAEFWPNGDDKFACSGTNPSSKDRVYMFSVSRYIAENCATVEEAVEMAKTLNVYSQDRYWNYCFMVGDASGNYGLIEFCMNNVIWIPKQVGQANFYINEIGAKLQDIKNGMGRLNVLKAGIDAVKTKEDMFNLIDKATYFQFYDPYNCKYDPRSENIGAFTGATYDFLMNDDIKEYVMYLMDEFGKPIRKMSRLELQDACEYWESIFTEVADCAEKSIFIRFYENDDLKYKITFDGVVKTDVI